MQTKKVENYSLGAFIKDVLQARDEGYDFDWESNVSVPVAFGGYYVGEMYKAALKKQVEVTSEVEQSVQKVTPTQVDSEEGDDDKDETPTRRKGGRKTSA